MEIDIINDIKKEIKRLRIYSDALLEQTESGTVEIFRDAAIEDELYKGERTLTDTDVELMNHEIEKVNYAIGALEKIIEPYTE